VDTTEAATEAAVAVVTTEVVVAGAGEAAAAVGVHDMTKGEEEGEPPNYRWPKWVIGDVHDNKVPGCQPGMCQSLVGPSKDIWRAQVFGEDGTSGAASLFYLRLAIAESWMLGVVASCVIVLILKKPFKICRGDYDGGGGYGGGGGGGGRRDRSRSPRR